MDKETKKALIQMGNISGMGIALGLTIFGCFYLGLYLDSKLGTSYFFTFFFLLVGIAAGFKNIYNLIKRSLRDEKPAGKGESNKEKGPPKKD